MFFNKKDDATTAEKKVHTLAPAFRYPKVKHREKNLFTQDSPSFNDDIDNYLPEYNPTAHLKVDLPSLNLNPDSLPPLVKPATQELPIFSLEDDLETNPELISSIFLEEDPSSLEQESSFSPSFSGERGGESVSLETPITALSEPAFNLPSEMPSLSSYEAPPSFEATDSDVENVYETVLTHEIEDLSKQTVLEEEHLPSPHVAKPAPEKLTPAEELSFQDRTLAFENEDHYYNPLAIGETLPSYRLAETQAQKPIDTTELDVFEDLEEADLDLQESFTVAQKSSEAVEVVFGASPTVEAFEAVEAPVEDAVFEEEASVEVVFEAEPSNDPPVLSPQEEDSPFSFPSIEEPPSLSALDASLDSSLDTSLDASLNASLDNVFEEDIFHIPELPETRVATEEPPYTPVDENTFDFSIFLDENPQAEADTASTETLVTPEADASFVTAVSTEEAHVETTFSLEGSIESPTESFESVEVSEFPSSETVVAEDDDDLQFSAEPFASPSVETNFIALEENLETLSDANLEQATLGLETPLNEDPSEELLPEILPDALPIDASFAEEDDPFETLPPELSSLEETTPTLSYETFRQLEEGDDGLDTVESTLSNHFSIESDTVLEDPNAFLDPNLFFSLEGLEDGSAPEELSMDLDPLPDFESQVPISPPQVYTSSETSVAQSNQNELIPQLLQIQTEDEFITLVPPQGTSEATLEEYARLALEDLDILASQPFPYGESHLCLVHVNNMYAIIALKQNKYTLLQSFSTLPEGVETAETAEGLKSKDGTLQVTWNASSYNEHIFDLHLGAWHALVVEDSQNITLMK
ncbi:MAG: hypothetical protein ACK551_05815 [Vampirovibrionales bacterium]